MDHNDLKVSEFNKIVGQRILKQRLNKKLTQTKLAKQLFVTFQHLGANCSNFRGSWSNL